MSNVLHDAAGVFADGAIARDIRAAVAVTAALHALEAGAERIAVLGAVEHAGAVVAKVGSPVTEAARRRLLAEIDACSRAGTRTSDGLRDARVEAGPERTSADGERGRCAP